MTCMWKIVSPDISKIFIFSELALKIGICKLLPMYGTILQVIYHLHNSAIYMICE